MGNALGRRITSRVGVTLTLAAAVLVSRVAAQQPNPGSTPIANVGWGITVSLVVFGALLVIAPNFTRQAADLVREKPGKCFLYGSGGIFLLIIAIFLVRPNPVVAIPSIYVLTVVVSSIGLLAIGRAVSDRWIVAVPVAAVVSTAVGATPYLGILTALILGCQGLGAAYLVSTGDVEGDDEPSSRFSTENLHRQ